MTGMNKGLSADERENFMPLNCWGQRQSLRHHWQVSDNLNNRRISNRY